MKRCKDCKWASHRWSIDCAIREFWGKQHECKYYVRDRWRPIVFAVIIIVVFLTLALLLTGCVHVKLPDGTEYWRVGEQAIGEVLLTMPDGTEFLMERQKSSIPVLIVTPAGLQLGEARRLKP